MTDPEPLKEELEYLAGQCQRLGRYYVAHREFDAVEDKFDLLGEVAGQFFSDASTALHEAFFVCAARLLDPDKSYGKDNLSVEGFFTRWKDHGSCSEPAEKARERLKNLKKKSKDYRNKFVAHNDREFYLKNEPDTGWDEDDLTNLMRDLQTILDETCRALDMKCFARIVPEHSQFGLPRLTRILDEAVEADAGLLQRRVSEDFESFLRNLDQHRRETGAPPSDRECD